MDRFITIKNFTIVVGILAIMLCSLLVICALKVLFIPIIVTMIISLIIYSLLHLLFNKMCVKIKRRFNK